MRLKKPYRIAWRVLLCCAALGLCLGVSSAIRSCVRRVRAEREARDTTMICNTFNGRIETVDFGRLFNDLNEVQLEAARRCGIKPVASRTEAEQLTQELVRIETCDLYAVDSLTHSIPYLTPGAAQLLNDIAEAFRDSLRSKGLNPNLLIVTSVLRTDEDVLRLRQGNINATEQSTHCYGTTFDIAWLRYRKVEYLQRHPYESVSPDVLKLVLGQVLRDFRKQERCYVKYERKQVCFHITSRQ